MHSYIIPIVLLVLGFISVAAGVNDTFSRTSFINPSHPVSYIAGVIMICSDFLGILIVDVKLAIERKNKDK